MEGVLLGGGGATRWRGGACTMREPHCHTLTWSRGAAFAQAELPKSPLVGTPPTVHLRLRRRVQLNVAHIAERV